jgi:hypothetical protein
MNSFTNYLEEKLLQHAFTGTAYTQPSGRYVGLFTTAPTEGSLGSEVTGGAYARQTATFTVNNAYEIDPVGAPGVLVTAALNNAVIEFPTATVAWGVVSHIGVFDAVTGGNMLAYGALTAARNVTDGDIFRIPVNNLKITLD